MKLSCPDCGAPIVIPDGELTLPDQRCSSCADRAAAREQRRRTRTGITLIVVGLLAFVVVVLMARAGVNPGESGSDDTEGDFGIIGLLAFGGLSCLVLGTTYLPRFLSRRLKS